MYAACVLGASMAITSKPRCASSAKSKPEPQSGTAIQHGRNTSMHSQSSRLGLTLPRSHPVSFLQSAPARNRLWALQCIFLIQVSSHFCTTVKQIDYLAHWQIYFRGLLVFDPGATEAAMAVPLSTAASSVFSAEVAAAFRFLATGENASGAGWFFSTASTTP